MDPAARSEGSPADSSWLSRCVDEAVGRLSVPWNATAKRDHSASFFTVVLPDPPSTSAATVNTERGWLVGMLRVSRDSQNSCRAPRALFNKPVQRENDAKTQRLGGGLTHYAVASAHQFQESPSGTRFTREHAVT